MEFKSFPDVKQIGKAAITITQKLHGTNAQIVIFENRSLLADIPASMTMEEAQALYPGKKLEISLYSTYNSVLKEIFMDVRAGSRNRWLTPDDDNFGFARFVEDNKAELIEKLGEGTWYGEWVGPGINSSEGLSEKTFAVFNIGRIDGKQLPARVVGVPLLYQGAFSSEAIDAAFNDLKTNGSKLVPGFMSPEGIVVHLLGTDLRFKKVFKPEETAWKKPARPKGEPKPAAPDISHLLQPIRLEKLLSRDERYIVSYPETLSQICRDYTEDLIKEGQITGDKDQVKLIKKALGGELFAFVKAFMNEKGL